MSESNNWERAETQRHSQRLRERVADERLQLQQEVIAECAANARNSAREALEFSRQSHRQLVAKLADDVKAEGSLLRQELVQAKQSWQHRGRAQPRADENTKKAKDRMEVVRARNSREAGTAQANLRRNQADTAHEATLCVRAVRDRSQMQRRVSKERMDSSRELTLQNREETVEQMRQQQLSGAEARKSAQRVETSRRSQSHDRVANALSLERVRDFKAQERARKAASARREREQLGRYREQAEDVRRADAEHRRRLHDGVRRSCIEGWGDRRTTAYSSFAHSGTSLWSQARNDGAHPYAHDLPNARSPAGRWLREYAQALVGSTASRGSVGRSTSSLSSVTI